MRKGIGVGRTHMFDKQQAKQRGCIVTASKGESRAQYGGVHHVPHEQRMAVKQHKGYSEERSQNEKNVKQTKDSLTGGRISYLSASVEKQKCISPSTLCLHSRGETTTTAAIVLHHRTAALHKRHHVRGAHPPSQLVVTALFRGHVQHCGRYVHSHKLLRVVLEPAADQPGAAPEVKDIERLVQVGEHIAIVSGAYFLGQGQEGGIVDVF